ncbi:uncharacterized protein EKO05_0007124 [Ascochyta rabiei]|uniref:Uncharacterized protein n=1 Tax=Didymella rabiei TaxID=5454 RepID=A0A163H0Y1_DIDRA|nr:uncharacterized protein EKO05_0007124 [Ascochyta rabiei]KZM25103.1 hypothetical protein ST47_g3753 [Ascochyta rabiei]UPX16737.1 hypothetical protein EKO05_0007124 [Ascochyta rabiei]
MLSSTLFLLWATFLQCVVGMEMKRQQRTVMTGSGTLGGTFYYNFNGPNGELCHAEVLFRIAPGNGQPSFRVNEVWCNTRLGHTFLRGAVGYSAVLDRGQGRLPSFQVIELGINIPNQALVMAQGLYRFNGAQPRINASVDRWTPNRFTFNAFRLGFLNPRQGAHCLADASGTICDGSSKRDPQGGFAHGVDRFCYATCPR